MKKLKLDFQHLGNAEVLTRSQLKQIMGGDGGSGGIYPCQPNMCSSDSECHGAKCKAVDCENSSGSTSSYKACLH